ncbi:hypothetical protein [Pseudomonas sp. CCOS 191]|uniref:hypothetical protein n=1 Tax=Pseudomonas sp. CCOS 191 TaxID=1649877 RepID=UPI0006249909|nr:hypothetical protein [Pseudomonas sp. CCOS 191]CRI56376.1 hypothetical protein CCOS191_1840 [Pseudomonas sp. CCOS 191]
MSPAFHTEAHRVARKRHTCTECRGHIEPGDRYEFVSGLWEGDVSTYKTCADCETARDFYVNELNSTEFRDVEYGAYCYSEVRCDLEEAATEIPSGTGLKFRAYRHVVGMRRRGNAAREERNAALMLVCQQRDAASLERAQ